MIEILCASREKNLESEMRYEPIVVSMKKSQYEHELVNLNDSSTVSNKTEITTTLPTIFYTSDKESLNFQGKIFIFNCPMPKDKVDFFTQMLHWTENDTTTTIVSGKEYIFSEGEQKIYVFEVNRPRKKKNPKSDDDLDLSNSKHFLSIVYKTVGAISAYVMGSSFVKEFIRNNPRYVDSILRRLGLLRNDGTPIFTPIRAIESEIQLSPLLSSRTPSSDDVSIDSSEIFRLNVDEDRSSSRVEESVTKVEDDVEEDVEKDFEDLLEPLLKEAKQKGEEDLDYLF